MLYFLSFFLPSLPVAIRVVRDVLLGRVGVLVSVDLDRQHYLFPGRTLSGPHVGLALSLRGFLGRSVGGVALVLVLGLVDRLLLHLLDVGHAVLVGADLLLRGGLG